jgi:hypothetical protein
MVAGEPILAYNLSLLMTFPLAAWGMYLLALRWTGRRDAALVAGLVFAFSPYRFAAISHLQLLTFQWLPYVLLYLERARKGRTLRPYSLLLLFLALQVWASWYLAVYTLVIVGMYAAGLRLTRRSGLYLGLTLLLGGGLTLPLAWPYFGLVDELRAARPLSQALALAAVPADFVAAAPFNRLFGPLTEALRARPGFTEENLLFLGFTAPLLALIALLPRQQFRLHHALFFILFLPLALTFATPYAALAHLIPASTIIRVPPRWVIPAIFALAGLAALGYRRVSAWAQGRGAKADTLMRGCVFALLLAESFSVPLPLAPVENRGALNPAYHWLAGQPGEVALLELPLHSAPAPEYPEVKRLYASTLGWWRLVNGYSGYTPPRRPQLAGFPDGPSVQALQALAGRGTPFYLLVHSDEAPFDRTQWEGVARWNPALRPIGQFAGDYLYEIMPPVALPLAAPPQATFGPQQNIRLWTAQYEGLSPQIALYWQATTPLTDDYTVFIHLRAADGFLLDQADGPPVSGHYPTGQWLPGEIIQDVHPLPPEHLSRVAFVAIGLYNPISGERLPAFDATGKRWDDEALVILLSSKGENDPRQDTAK